MDKRAGNEGNEKSEALKMRLRGVRKRKQAQQRLGRNASGFRTRLVEARRRIDH